MLSEGCGELFEDFCTIDRLLQVGLESGLLWSLDAACMGWEGLGVEGSLVALFMICTMAGSVGLGWLGIHSGYS